MKKPSILILNGSLGGQRGNTAELLRRFRECMLGQAEVRELRLPASGPLTWAESPERPECLESPESPEWAKWPKWPKWPKWEEVREALRQSDGFVFATGTYWDSWGSGMQRFLEQATETEGDPDIWLGKPAAALVTMHSVGGKGVLSRLQGVLSTFGCLIPPMSGMVYSAANHHALRSAAGVDGDFWRPEDLSVVAHNLLEALRGGRAWQGWPVEEREFAGRWFFN